MYFGWKSTGRLLSGATAFTTQRETISVLGQARLSRASSDRAAARAKNIFKLQEFAVPKRLCQVRLCGAYEARQGQAQALSGRGELP